MLKDTFFASRLLKKVQMSLDSARDRERAERQDGVTHPSTGYPPRGTPRRWVGGVLSAYAAAPRECRVPIAGLVSADGAFFSSLLEGGLRAAIEELKAALCLEIDRQREETLGIAQRILQNPELGFKEVATARLVADRFRALDIPCRTGARHHGGEGSPGHGQARPPVAVLGELDSVLVYDHPHANRETGAAHACGHNVQIATLLAVAGALRASKALPGLSGRVVLFAVPAEDTWRSSTAWPWPGRASSSSWAGSQS